MKVKVCPCGAGPKNAEVITKEFPKPIEEVKPQKRIREAERILTPQRRKPIQREKVDGRSIRRVTRR